MSEKKYQEVEMKFKVRNSKEIEEILGNLGAEKLVDQIGRAHV